MTACTGSASTVTVLELVNSPEPPRRLLLGDGNYDAVSEVYRRRMAEWADREMVSRTGG
jgi:hypothetical protein